MPAKSRKNRRLQTKREIPSAGGSNISNTDNAISTQSSGQVNQPVLTSKAAKAAATEAPVGAYFATEVKWISIVAGIIIVLLIVSYYIFR